MKAYMLLIATSDWDSGMSERERRRRVPRGEAEVHYVGPAPTVFAGGALGGGVGAILGFVVGGPVGAAVLGGLLAAVGGLIGAFIETAPEARR